MSNKIEKTSEIKVKVGLNKDMIPVDIKWLASDSESSELKDCKTINVSIWDPYENNSLAINLWTQDMRIDEMHTHYFRTLMNLTSSYYQATKNPLALKMMKEFCEELSAKTSDWEESKS